MSNRNYFKLTPQLGMWYVSHFGNLTQDNKTTTIGFGSSSGQLRSSCIVGGPFSTKERAEQWCEEHPEHGIGAEVWRQEV